MLPGQLLTYDPERDGNPFEFIIRASAQVRARHNQDAQAIRIERALVERLRAQPARLDMLIKDGIAAVKHTADEQGSVQAEWLGAGEVLKP